MNTLSDRNDDDSSRCRLFEELEDVGAIGGDVSGAVALQDDALDRRVEEMGDCVAADRREEAEKDHVAIQGRVNAELERMFFLCF